MNVLEKSFVLGTLCLSSSALFAAKNVVGKVCDTKGNPIPGVTIMVKGTTIGTTSDINGEYRISIEESQSDNTLEFSYLGFNKEERSMSDVVDVTMSEDMKALGEILVTTQKRTQTRIEVPTSVSALSGNGLNQLGVSQMDQMADYIPGLEIQIQSPNNPGYVIRGVTSDDGAAYSQPRISVFQDGVSTSRSRASVAEVFDMERVEVVKGPQGTLFGRGAEIGAIHMIRNKANDELSGELSLKYGSYNERGVTGYLNTPIISQKLANRFAFSYDAHDGYIKNLSGGRLNGKSAMALRNSTKFVANDKTTFNLILDYQYDNYPGTSFKSDRLAPVGGDTSPYSAASLERGEDLSIVRHMGGATLLSDYVINDSWGLSSITGFRAFKSDELFDADGTYLPLLDCEEFAKGTQLSQEFRLNYSNGRNFSGFVGTSYFYENSLQQAKVKTNMQYFYPAYAYQGFACQVKPQFEALTSQLGALFPAAMEPAVEQIVAGLMNKWFPDSYELASTMVSTPDFYGDMKQALSAYGMDFDQLLGAMGSQGEAILSTLKGSSALPLSPSHVEEGTNYGVNQAAEVYADGTLKLCKGLSLTAGLRGSYEHQTTGYASSTIPDPVFGSILYKPTQKRVNYSSDYVSWVGRVALNYMFKHNNAYISVSRGRRPGVLAFNNDPNDLTKLKPEIIVSYELGLKGILAQGRLQYELSTYYYDWSHFQTQTLVDNPGTVGKLYVADDAGKAHSFGVEAGVSYAPAAWLSFFGNYAYIDGKFSDKDGNGQEQAYAGNRFRLTPKHSYSMGLDVHFPISEHVNFYLRPSYAYKSKVYFEDSNEEELSQNGYGLLNLNTGIRIQSRKLYYEISGYGKNLGNQEYLIDAGNSGRSIDYPTFIAGSPRVIGVQFKLGF